MLGNAGNGFTYRLGAKPMDTKKEAEASLEKSEVFTPPV
jgi:hypothetical protein